MRVLGMISGTSFDAIDLAAADFAIDGDAIQPRSAGRGERPVPPSLCGLDLWPRCHQAVTAKDLRILDTRMASSSPRSPPPP